MEITKIKRVLSKYGIGSPLNQLVYSDKEISDMKKAGLIFSGIANSKVGRPVGSKNRSFEERLKTMKKGIALTNGKLVINGRFNSVEEAEKFRDWNYGEKGKFNWEVIEIK